MKFKLRKRLVSWCGLSLGALAFAFGVNAASIQQLDQFNQVCDQQAPDAPCKKYKTTHVCKQEGLGGRVIRTRQHKNHVTTTTICKGVKRNVLQWDSGSESEQEEPIEKIGSGEREQIWENQNCAQSGQDQQQQPTRSRRKMHTNTDQCSAPVADKSERHRTHHNTVLDTGVEKTVVTDEEEWTSYSEEDIPAPKVCKKTKKKASKQQ